MALAAAVDDATLPAGDRAPLDEGDFWNAIAVLQQRRSRTLCEALGAAAAGDGALLAQALPDPAEPEDPPDNAEESNWARVSLDAPCPEGYDLAAHRAFIEELVADAPLTGLVFGQRAAMCLGWSVVRAHPPTPIGASTPPPMLVIGGRHDPVLPYAESEALVAALDNGSCLAAYEGEGHVAWAAPDLDAIAWTVAFIDDPSVFPTECD